MTRDWFDVQLGRMVVLRGMPGDSEGYWEALSDIPESVLEAAIGHAIRTRAWFPTPAEIRLDCDAVTTREAVLPPPKRMASVDLNDPRAVTIANPFGGTAITVLVTRDYWDDCDLCRDTGWAKFWCGSEPNQRFRDLPPRRCDRVDPHYEHDWSDRCACVNTNPTIQRRKAAGTRYSQEPAKVGAV